MKKISVLLVDDHALLRQGLHALLNLHKDIEVIGDAENGLEAIQRVRELKPDVVVMDLMMPVMDGLTATRQIKAEYSATKILILTTFGSSADVAFAFDDGASGAIMKGATKDELLRAIRIVASGGTVVDPEIEKTIRDEPRLKRLTDKQVKILGFVTKGLSNVDIAQLLDISSDMVKQHLTVIFSKLGAANRAEAIGIALRKHLLKI